MILSYLTHNQARNVMRKTVYVMDTLHIYSSLTFWGGYILIPPVEGKIHKWLSVPPSPKHCFSIFIVFSFLYKNVVRGNHFFFFYSAPSTPWTSWKLCIIALACSSCWTVSIFLYNEGSKRCTLFLVWQICKTVKYKPQKAKDNRISNCSVHIKHISLSGAQVM